MTKEQINVYTGKKIKEFRNLAGIKQDLLAVHAGISRPAVTNIETGRCSMSFTILTAICSILGCEYADVLPPIPKHSPKYKVVEKTVIIRQKIKVRKRIK